MNVPEPVPPELAVPLARAAERLGVFGSPFTWYSEVSSTNDIASALADAGAAEGTVVAANRQTAGRGRHGRAWASPPGAGLYVSAVVRPRPDMLSLLTIAAGVAVADGIEASTGLRLDLKWPNDVCAGSRKVAGVLAEASSMPTGSGVAGGVRHVVIGFGINVLPAAYPPEIDKRATSLEGELGRAVDRGFVLAECLVALALRCEDLRQGRHARVADAWRSRASAHLGRRVRLGGDQPQDGTAEGIDSTGALLVRVGHAVVRVISSEVAWL